MSSDNAMRPNLDRLIRPDIEKMESYAPIVPFDILSARLGYPPEQLVKLDANENPYGPSPKVYQALAAEPYYHIYPDPESQALREGLSAYLDIEKESILAGSGADELIDILMRLCLEPGDAILNCPPTFGMYSFLAGLCGGRVLRIPRIAEFALDLDAIERAAAGAHSAKLLLVASPNNPDGSMLPDDALRRLLDLPLLIVLDEAYIEFSGMSRVKWVAEYPNLVVLRTFSKWAGLAGLRIGYGVFPQELIRHAWKIKQPYNVNVAAKTAALASLQDLDYLRGNVAKIVAERERLYQALLTVPFLQPYPSHSNFILCRVVGREAEQVKQALERRGILLRYYETPELLDCVRISVGLPDQTDRLITELQKLS